jgi:uncharacterized protein YdaU (DUF1376 family)
MHYYKRNLGDYAKKAGRLTMLQHGAYTLLIDSCYDREVFPTLEQAIEWTWASTEAEVDAVKFVLSRFFSLTKDGEYVQDRILEELLQYHKNADTNKRIADEREAKRREKSTKREQSVNEAPPNQEPLTKNQEPLTNIKEGKPSLSGTAFPPCPHTELLKLWGKHLSHLTQPRTWEGNRQANMRQRWIQAGKPSAYSPEGYKTTEEGLKWWDSFFGYIANDTSLANGFETKGRTWRPDLEWVVNATNFQKIIDGKYAK